MKRRQGDAASVAGLLTAFVAASTVLGLLAAGIFMPIAGIAGMSTKSVVTAFDALPAQFTASPLAQQSRILAADGSVMATLYKENRLVVPLSQIGDDMRMAQVAIEDRRFYEHGGIDGKGILRSIATAARGGDKQGASTLTQQYVRQLLITTARQNGNEKAAEAAQVRSGIAGYVRKIQEMKYAISMEQRRSKDQILEGYLNIVYYGAGAYGVEAAAHRYYDTTAADLTLPQSAMIAGLAQNPGTADPINNPKRAIERRNVVLSAMNEQGLISTARMRRAQNATLGLDVQPLKPSCPSATDPYVCYYVVNWLLDQPALGKTPEEREKRLFYGGLNIRTTFDPALTTYTRKVLADRVSPTNAARRGAAAAVVEPGTGRVLAIGQNTTWDLVGGPGKTSVNWAVDQKYGASGGFQIGSTAKMFAVVTALEQGMTANSSFYAPPDGTHIPGRKFDGEKCGVIDRYFAPYNAEGEEHGMTTLREATVKSINTAFAQLATKVGVCNERETMKKMGLHRSDGKDYGVGGIAATVLGADNASPLTLAASYATLASGGMYCEPRPVESVIAFDSTELPIGENKCRRAVDPKIAYDTTKILTGVLAEGGTGSKAAFGRPAAGKTGTADNSTETWFAGYTPQLAAAVWYGTPYTQRSVHAYGGTVAAPLWRRIMTKASDGMDTERFRLIENDTPQEAKDNGETVSVPDVVGRSQESATQILQDAGFSVKVDDNREQSSAVAPGAVVKTSPDGATRADAGATVTLTLSRGGRPE
ncbi:transglycosylase domain-containing protein [Mobilicoccus sp.]|uniref:transglycosylase domain-containing protein n=1 Tax=Mobilicoccus sp. TaxID=2034349 RepID=UPI00289BFDDE|nr:transglycosylase domain-containing protein [Mobilicoccus sp.]